MSAKTQSKSSKAGAGQWLIIAALVIVAGGLSALYAVNEYAGGTKQIVDRAKANTARFESLYRDATEKRLATLRFGLDLLMADDEIVNNFAANDRPALAAKITGFFNEVLHPRYGLDQLNFFTPPATVYLRADDPKVFGNDLSSVRRTVVIAGERRQMVSGMETGLGGVVALRAVAPVIHGGKLTGTMGVGDSITQYLTKAAETTGMDWALGLDQQVGERAERKPDPKTDAVQGKDVFFVYSNPTVGNHLRGVSFDPRSAEPVLAAVGSRTVFIKAFPLNNFSGTPTVVIATLRDVTEAFADVRQSVAIKAAILFLALSVAGSLAVTRFRAMRDGLNAALLGQRRELEEKTAALDAARTKLKDAEQLKRGFLTNLVTALSEPLQAVSGQLQAVGPQVEDALRGTLNPGTANREGIVDQLRLALWETTRAARFIGDYQQLELFRQRLVKADTPLVSVNAVIAQALDEDAATTLRLTGLEVDARVSADLPRLRADAGLLRRAVACLVNHAAGCEPGGRLSIDAAIDEDAWLAISFTGPAFRASAESAEETVERARHFLAHMPEGPAALADCDAPLGIVLALVIVEFLGGRLVAAEPRIGQPGYAMLLPAIH